ncbi:MAG: YkgJ family cysteine cluster protein [Desulfovibrio aminophilus]|uniref:YkgJ family cysteine cluster protein n=1 Tax=Desulfovibrio aminophilus TaxID=81425 RepID=UPI0039EC2B90
MSSERNTTFCARCGECCRKGGPALHTDDLPLLRAPGGPDLVHLVTLRAGEPAMDQIGGRLAPLETEIVKIKGRDGAWTCLFFSDEGSACAIYTTRPLECRILSCRDTREIERVYARDRLTRRDILPAGHPLLELVAEHERRCPVSGYAGLLESDAPEDRRSRAAMLAWDREVRLLLTEKSGMDPAILDFLFGRPLELLTPSLTAARRHA